MHKAPVIFECGSRVRIGCLYEPILDAILIVQKVLTQRNTCLVIVSWEDNSYSCEGVGHQNNLAFDFQVRGLSANQANAIWRDVQQALHAVDRTWEVSHDGEIFCVEYRMAGS